MTMLRVLTYHRIAEPDERPDLDPLLVSATPETFRAHVRHLVRRHRPVSLDEVVAAFTGTGSLPERAVLVTFDDGYRDFAQVAWPILKELGVPVTLFVPTAYPGRPGRAFWWDRLHRATVLSARSNGHARPEPLALAPDVRLDEAQGIRRARALLKSLPHDEAELLVDRVSTSSGAASNGRDGAVLSWTELRRLGSEGVTFGAHTHHHVALPSVPERRRRWEIRRSLDEVRDRLGAWHAVLSYPYGFATDEVAATAAEEGCVLGFTNGDGLNRPGHTDPLRLHRTNITPRTTARLFPLRMMPWFTPVDRWRHREEPVARAT